MTLSDITLALSQIASSAGVRQAAFLLHGATPRYGHAVLGGGAVVVPATWVQSGSIIVVTPYTAGTGILSVNPGDYVVGVSFKIVSNDNTDGRTVHWIAMQEGTNVHEGA